MKPHSEKFLKRRKFFCVLPVLMLPFVTLAFWAIGGGVIDKDRPVDSFLNRELPNAIPTDEPFDKLSLYNQADKDTARLQEQLLEDGLVDNPGPGVFGIDDTSSIQELNIPEAKLNGYHSIDLYEGKINERIARLRETMNGYPDEDHISEDRNLNDDIILPPTPDSTINARDPDPELQQLDAMLEKLLDLQNPDRLQNKVREQSLKAKNTAFPMLHYENPVVIEGMRQLNMNGHGDTIVSPYNFIDISGLPLAPEINLPSGVSAVVHETISLVNGAAIKLRILTEVFVNGKLIPAGTLVSGKVNISGERLMVEINTIREGQSIIPVSLSVFDFDALEGIRIPDAISREAAKEGMDRAVQGVQLMSLEQSAVAQAATAGVEAAKGLLGKRARLVRVTVKAGYPVLLINKGALQGN